jgi:DHA2 family multidrug resistance protein
MQQAVSLVEYGPRRIIITITAVVCALLEIIDTTIVNVALPTMRGSLGATLNEVSWVITAYSLANVIIVPMTSWLSQQFWFSSSLIVTLSVTAVYGIFFFIWRELVYRYPIVELRVLQNGNLRIGVILSFIMGFGLFGSTFVIPLYTQPLLGWTAQQSGMLQLPSTLFVAVMMPVVAQLIQRGVPQKYLIAIGMSVFFIYSFLAYKILTPDTGSRDFFWILIIRGFGLGLLSVPVSTMSLSTLKGPQIGQGAAFSGMMRQLGGAFGVAIISTMVTRQTDLHRTMLVSHLNINDPAVQQRVARLAAGMHSRGYDLATAQQKAYALLDGSVMRQATVLSYMDVFLWVGVMFMVCVPFVLLFIKTTRNKVSLAGAAH